MVRHDLRHYRYLSYVDVDRCYYKLHHAHVLAVPRQANQPLNYAALFHI
nr:MAG TPA: hypothetical protein [Caudoviricetes sp.]